MSCQPPVPLESEPVFNSFQINDLMTETAPTTSYKQIFRFWLPLAATWIMMSVEGPYIAAIIARLGAEKENLAAYGVAFAFALVMESPVIMLMSASTALCRDRLHYQKLRNFSLFLSLAVTPGDDHLPAPPGLQPDHPHCSRAA